MNLYDLLFENRPTTEWNVDVCIRCSKDSSNKYEAFDGYRVVYMTHPFCIECHRGKYTTIANIIRVENEEKY